MNVGHRLSSEEHPPHDLVANAKRARLHDVSEDQTGLLELARQFV